MASENHALFKLGSIPHCDGGVSSRRREPLSIGRESNRVDPAAIAIEGSQALSSREIPDDYFSVFSA